MQITPVGLEPTTPGLLAMDSNSAVDLVFEATKGCSELAPESSPPAVIDSKAGDENRTQMDSEPAVALFSKTSNEV